MSIHVALRHQTTYSYARPIALDPQVIRLRPAPHCRTPILSYSLKIEPASHFLNWQQDPQGNYLARAVFPEKVSAFSVTVDLIADMAVINPFDFFIEPQAENFPFAYDHVLDEELAPFRKLAPPGPLLKKYIAIEHSHDALTVIQRSVVEIDVPRGTLNAGPAWETLREAMLEDDYPDVAEFIYPSPHVILDDAATLFALQAFTPGAPVAEAALKLACLFKSEFTYAPGATTIATSVPEILEGRRGVCQDFAHAMIAGLRALKIPVRYVSGHLKTYAPQRDGEQSPALVGADATHAWVSVWCGPELGWMDFDPTNALAVTDEHIAVAYGRDFSDVTQLRGVIVGGGTHTPDVRVTVTPLEG